MAGTRLQWQILSLNLMLGVVLLAYPLHAHPLQWDPFNSWILAQSTPELYHQLDQAVARQNWSEAITLVDQLIQANPDRREELEAYQAQLAALATSSRASTGDTSSVSLAPAEADLFQEILQQVQACVVGQVTDPTQLNTDTLLTMSQQCLVEAVMQSPDGGIRPNAENRLKTVMKATGASLPRRTGTGQTELPLQPLTGTRLFTLPVTLGSVTAPFLLDTGATNTVIKGELAEQLNLPKTPISNNVLEMGVVGDNCPSEGSSALHSLPAVLIGSSQVDGLLGLSLPASFIPGQQAGALGIDFLSAYDVVLDPSTPSLALLPPSPLDPQGIPLKGELGLVTTEIYINDQGPFKLGLDTGAEVMVISSELKTVLGLNPTKTTEVMGFCGLTQTEFTQLEQVRILSHQVSQLDAVILDNPIFELIGVEGLVGQNFLNQFRQYWRFAPLDDLGFLETGSLTLQQF